MSAKTTDTADTRGRPKVLFWGCRGTRPTPGAAYVRYGGQTTCIEVRWAGDRLWIDAGSGLHAAAQDWAAVGGLPPRSREAAPGPRLLLSHLHLDHVIGLEALLPYLSPASPATLFVPGDAAQAGAALSALFRPPFWPIDLLRQDVFRIEPAPLRQALTIGAATIRPFPLNHPGGCAGFEVAVGGARIVVAGDHEHGRPDADAELERRAAGADLVIYDATYNDAEHAARRGWGHSTREHGLRLADRCRPRRLVLTHHSPEADDAILDAEAARLRLTERHDVLLARDGLTLTL